MLEATGLRDVTSQLFCLKAMVAWHLMIKETLFCKRKWILIQVIERNIEVDLFPSSTFLFFFFLPVGIP